MITTHLFNDDTLLEIENSPNNPLYRARFIDVHGFAKTLTFLDKVALFAIESHLNVNDTYDSTHYHIHLIATSILGEKYMFLLDKKDNENVLAAIWLHDTNENCRKNYSDIVKVSNTTVADIVYDVTNEKGKNRFERQSIKYFENLRKNELAVFVKLCDRIANVDYSKIRNESKFKMYKKENKRFVNSLYYSKYDIMFTHLRNLFIY